MLTDERHRVRFSRTLRLIVVLFGAISSNVLAQSSAGTLAITITGLPASVGAQILVTGPGGYSQSVSATTTLANLVPGAYSVAFAIVASPTQANLVYLPRISAGVNPIQITAGQSASVSVLYAPLSTVWEAIGPKAISGWFGSPGLGAAGELEAFAINQSNLLEMYAGAGSVGVLSEGGVYKTVDGGKTWTQSNSGLSDTAIDVLWLDQTNPSIVLAGTFYTGGIFRSTDGGAHWTATQTCAAITSPPGLVTAFVQADGILYAAADIGVVRSSDAGITWCNETQPSRTAVSALTSSGSVLYAGRVDGTILVRMVTGGSWTTTYPITPSHNSRVYSLSAHPTDPQTCYAVVFDYGTGTSNTFVTRDAGQTWRTIGGLVGGSLRSVAVSPANPMVIYGANDGNLYRSADGGNTWLRLPNAGDWDVRLIVPDAAGIVGTLVIGSDQGLYISSDNGVSWRSLNGNITSSIIFTVAVQDQRIVTTTQDFSGLVSLDGGQSWKNQGSSAEEGQALFNGSYAYLYTQDGFQYSIDGGKTFNVPASIPYNKFPGGASNLIAVDARTPATIYVVGSDGFYKSTDQGKTFTVQTWQLPQKPTLIEVDPNDSRTIFAGVRDSQNHCLLYYSHDGGANWTQSNLGTPGTWPCAIAVDPLNSSNVFFGMTLPLSAGVSLSTDGGRTFDPANRGIDANGGREGSFIARPNVILSLNFDPSFPGIVAATSITGVYLSSDLGTHWISIRANALPRRFDCVTWSGGYLYAATDGEGVLRMPFPSLPPPPSLMSAALADATVGQPYAAILSASGGTPPYTWMLSAGAALPKDLVMTPDGKISGIPISQGTFAFSVTLADALGQTVGQQFTLRVVPDPQAPSIKTVVNAASFDNRLAPNTWFTVFGDNLGAAGRDGSTTSLGGASLTVCGIPAVINFNSGQGQLNSLVPSGTPLGQCPVVATVNGRFSAPSNLTISAQAPGVFRFVIRASGLSLPVATHADYSVVGPQAAGLTPARNGETIILWSTGWNEGAAAPAVTIGGIPTKVAYYGPSQSPGLDQINVVVPTGLATGLYDLVVEAITSGKVAVQ